MLIGKAFSRLGISATKDTHAIKMAYQRLLPQNHPEENPQGFMELHEAYKEAMAYARNHPISAAGSSWRPEPPSRLRETAGEFDGFFADLAADTEMPEPPRKEFERMRKKLYRSILPIPAKKWKHFFASREYLLCRNDSGCMEQLFHTLLNLIHSYPSILLILNELWDLAGYLQGEGNNVLVEKTNKCISELKKQYSHCLKATQKPRLVQGLFQVLWYYQALPFLLKLPASAVILPVISGSSEGLLILVILGFYIVELWTSGIKKKRKLGILYRQKKISSLKRNTVDDLLLIGGIFAVAFHLSICFVVWEYLHGG